jgi:hypothetical protein
LIDSLSALEGGRQPPSRTVRQGGSGLVLNHNGSLNLIYRNRRASLSTGEASHYLAAIGLRTSFYDINLMSEEVVLASVNGSLLVSHPQSEIWLDQPAVFQLLAIYKSGQTSPGAALPEWLVCSVAAGRLLLSDQRSGRWVLLGRDHMGEFERRLGLLTPVIESSAPLPPVINLKGLEIHLQSAFRLARTLRHFAGTRAVDPYEDSAPDFKLSVGPAQEGIQISDTNSRVGLTAREAIKWAQIVDTELARLHADEIIRGRITTVFADAPGGRFVLQWGDEVFVPHGYSHQPDRGDNRLIHATDRGFILLLDSLKSACVALTVEEDILLARSLGDRG